MFLPPSYLNCANGGTCTSGYPLSCNFTNNSTDVFINMHLCASALKLFGNQCMQCCSLSPHCGLQAASAMLIINHGHTAPTVSPIDNADRCIGFIHGTTATSIIICLVLESYRDSQQAHWEWPGTLLCPIPHIRHVFRLIQIMCHQYYS